MVMLLEKIPLWYCVILHPKLMKVQTSKGKVPHPYTEFTRRIMTFEYEKLLVLKSTQNKLASNIAITSKREKQVRHIIYDMGHFEIKSLILKMSQ